MTTSTSTAGFTIVELMVTLAVAAILMGYALPAFNDFLRQRTLTSNANDVLLAVTYARSEAARRGGNVVVEAIDPEPGNEWGGGFQVVFGGEVLRQFDAVPDQATAAALGVGDTLTFNARGLMTSGGAGSVQLCHADSTRGREIFISAIGRANVEELVCP